jgi:hypothetical protein
MLLIAVEAGSGERRGGDSMRVRLALVLMFGELMMLPTFTWAQDCGEPGNLLTSCGLELIPPDAGGRFSAAPGWVTDEGPKVPYLAGTPTPGDYNNSGIPVVPCPGLGCGAVDAADWVVYRKFLGTGFDLPNEGEGISTGNVTGSDGFFWQQHYGEPPVLSLSEPGNFGHLLLEGDWHHWFQPYNGTEAAAEDNFAHLTQTVPGTAGQEYTMKGWALFEDYFPGGRTNLNLDDGDANFEDGPLSPTDSFFGLDFLDNNGNVLAGSPQIELKAAGQPSNTTWMQHTLVAVAPPGTVNVRVRATMTDGVFNPFPESTPQLFQLSFFVDAFSLTAQSPGSGNSVPEPAACALALTGFCVGSACFRRLRSTTNNTN